MNTNFCIEEYLNKWLSIRCGG